MKAEELDLILMEAQQAGLGVVVETSEPQKLRSRLYPRMKATGLEYKIRIPDIPNTLFLIKKEALDAA
jgi:hypothetical protein